MTTTYTYDSLNRITSAHEEGVGLNTTRTYQYDSLGNLIREEQDGCVEYKYNGFALDESTKCGTIPNSIGTSFWEYTYDGRGNLVSNDKYTRTTSGMAWQNEETYVYDETNHMVDGKNELGERSLYTYNGLGLRVGRELIMKDNTHGYTDFHDQTPSVETGIDKPEVVKESYVIDYTSPTFQTLVMEEEGGFDYRWVYGLDKLSVKITSEGTNWWGQNVKTDILKDYLHQDRLGSTTNLTDKFGRVVGRADYNEWGEVTYKEALSITSSYRRIYPQLNYTGHDWDDVLEMYYAKARFYDPDAKRFVEIDPVKGQVTDPLSLVSYLYCKDNPLRWVDPLGLKAGDLLVNGTTISYLTNEKGETYGSLRDLAAAFDLSVDYSPYPEPKNWIEEYLYGLNSLYWPDYHIEVSDTKFLGFNMDQFENDTGKIGGYYYRDKAHKNAYKDTIIDIDAKLVPDNENPGYKKVIVNVQQFLNYMARFDCYKDMEIKYELGPEGGSYEFKNSVPFLGLMAGSLDVGNRSAQIIPREKIYDYVETVPGDFINNTSGYPKGAGYDILKNAITIGWNNSQIRQFYNDENVAYILLSEFVTAENYPTNGGISYGVGASKESAVFAIYKSEAENGKYYYYTNSVGVFKPY